jgi:hypothetical protein
MIADAIKHRVPDATLPDPDPADPDKWHRFPCPFCRRERAAINYAVNVFKCHHAKCRVTISVGKPAPDLVVVRFHFQIAQAVRSFKSKWRKLCEQDNEIEADAMQFARQCVVEYDRSGELDDWQMIVKNDPNQLDRFVLQALNRDLIDWVKARLRQENRDAKLAEQDIQRQGFRRPVSHYQAEIKGPKFVGQLRPTEDDALNDIMWKGWPYLDLRIRHNKTTREIARIMGVSVRTANTRMREEEDEAREALAEGM